jgi:tetrahydromethanopterin S-methyltransferase subunit E
MRELSDAPLANHTWTTAILNSLNAILPSSSLLTEQSTGDEVLAAIRQLPSNEQAVLLSASVDIIHGTFTLSNTTTNTPEPSPSGETTAESFQKTILHDLMANPSHVLMLTLAFFIVVACIVLMVYMTTAQVKTGKAPDQSLFTTLVNALTAIINALTGRN